MWGGVNDMLANEYDDDDDKDGQEFYKNCGCDDRARRRVSKMVYIVLADEGHGNGGNQEHFHKS
jgi:hypothetical protein